MKEIILNKFGERFYNKYYKGGNIEVMKNWLSKINERYKENKDIWESVVSVCGSSHIFFIELKGGKK